MTRKILLILGLVLATIAGPVAPSIASAEEATVAATSSSFGTLAERNAYISCVAPGTEVGLSLRIKLLNYAARALEGIRAGVPASSVTYVLRRDYGLTSTEASKVYWCTVRVWG